MKSSIKISNGTESKFARGMKNFTLPVHSSDGFEIYDSKGNKFGSVSGLANGRTAQSVVKAVNEFEALEAVAEAAARRERAEEDGDDNEMLAALSSLSDALLKLGNRAEGGQMKIKTTKQLCNARLNTHSLDGTLHVCKLPLNHKGPHRCGRIIGTLNATRRMRVCGRSWSKKNAK